MTVLHSSRTMVGEVSPVNAPFSSKYIFCAPSSRREKRWASNTSRTEVSEMVGGQRMDRIWGCCCNSIPSGGEISAAEMEAVLGAQCVFRFAGHMAGPGEVVLM